jgi:hypothetical protein
MNRHQAGIAAVAGAVGVLVGSGAAGMAGELALGPLRFDPAVAFVGGVTVVVVWALFEGLRRRTATGE